MNEKVFLLSNKSKFRTDADSNISVQFEANDKLLPNTDLGETLSLYDLYNEERDKTNKFRLIIDINPICSNVLFNNVSEIVKCKNDAKCFSLLSKKDTSFDELGIDQTSVVNKSISDKNGINRLDAIRDTEFSHSNFGDLIYRCGSDIFNNHILRANEFIHVGMADLTSEEESADKARKYFNTIIDYQRDSSGNIVVDNCYATESSGTTIDTHIHNLDSLMEIDKAFVSECIDKDGWFGFVNKTLIDIPNVKLSTDDGEKYYTLNKVINNKNACSFVDMYPDRSLFSFTPVYNKIRSRVERNWDYCITYPFESDYEKFNEINDNTVNAIKCIKTEITHNNSGDELIQFTTLVKHNLNRGSFVNLYYTQSASDRTATNVVPFKVRVVAVGDSEGNNQGTMFRIKMNDVSDYFENDEGRVSVIGGKVCLFFIKKVVRGTECKYYFRKFKKITYDNKLPSSEINKLAFAENIYGDHISQLIYTDDIDVTGLVDNLGMPITKLYLTIVKRNKGNVEWYEKNNFSGSTIECSHAFGKVTSGIELPETYYDYNIHKLHNLDFSHLESADEKDYENYEVGTLAVFSNFLTQPLALEGGGYNDKQGITVSDFDVFYGDIAEFNFEDCEETVIDYVYHRFNTKQREVYNPEYFDIYEDVLKYDDYFSPATKSLNNGQSAITGSGENETPMAGASNDGGNTIGGVDVSNPQIGNMLPNQPDTGLVVDPDFAAGHLTAYTSSDLVETRKINYAAIPNHEDVLYAANLAPEGYYYKPHHEIPIREKSSEINRVNVNFINYKAGDVIVTDGTTVIEYDDGTTDTKHISYLKIKPTVDYGFKPGDTIVLYNIMRDVTLFGFIDRIINGDIIAIFANVIINQSDIDNYVYSISHTNKYCPSYGRFSLQDCEVVWRDVLAPSKLLPENALYNTPFANGAFYVHKNINFFLRRQDPNNEYFMSNPEDDYRGVSGVTKRMRPFRLRSYGKMVLDSIKYLEELLTSDCM